MYQCSLSFLVSMILANKPKHKEKSPCMLRPKTQPVSSVRFDDHAKQRLFHKCDTTILLYNISTFRPGSLRGLCSILGVPRSALFCCSQMLFHGSICWSQSPSLRVIASRVPTSSTSSEA